MSVSNDDRDSDKDWKLDADDGLEDSDPLTNLYLALFVDLIGGMIVMPALPFVATAFGGTPLEVGAMTCAFTLSQMIGGSVLGPLSDKLGRRSLFLLSLVTTGVALILFAMSQSFGQLLASRAMDGFFSGSMGFARAMVVDLVPDMDRQAAMGKLGAFISGSIVIGPAIGGLLMTWGFLCVGLGTAAITFLNFFIALFSLPLERKQESSEDCEDESGNPIEYLKGLRGMVAKRPRLCGVLTAYLFHSVAMGVFVGINALYLRDELGFGARGVGLNWSFAGLVSIIVQAALVRPLCSMIGEPGTLVVGIVSRVLAFGAMFTFTDSWMPYIAPTTVIAGSGLVLPTMPSILAKLAPDEDKDGVLSAQQTLLNAGNFLGPLIGGLMYSASSPCDVWALPVALNIAAAVLAAMSLWKMDAAPATKSPLDANREEPLLPAAPSPKRSPSKKVTFGSTLSFALPPDVSELGSIWSVEMERSLQRSSRRRQTEHVGLSAIVARKTRRLQTMPANMSPTAPRKWRRWRPMAKALAATAPEDSD